MTTPAPTPALFAGRKAPSAPKPSETPSDAGTEGKATTRPRVPRLLVNHPELEEIMTRLKEDEQINAKHGWYDRNRNGNQHKKREQDRANGKLRSQRKNNNEKN